MSDNDTISRSHFDDRVRRIVSVDKELSADYLDGVDMVLYLLSTEPTVPHEMTAREYLLERNRLCRTVAGCDACPIFGDIHWDCEMLEKEFPQKAVAIVEAWAREHPERSEE